MCKNERTCNLVGIVSLAVIIDLIRLAVGIGETLGPLLPRGEVIIQIKKTAQKKRYGSVGEGLAGNIRARSRSVLIRKVCAVMTASLGQRNKWRGRGAKTST